MALDDVIVFIALGVLFLGLASLILARGYMRRNDLLYASETLWYATLALVISLGLMIWIAHWRVHAHIQGVWDYIQEFEEKYGSQE